MVTQVLQRVDCDALKNLVLLIGSSSGLQRVDCDVLVNLRATDSCVFVAKSTMYLARHIPNYAVGYGILKERGSKQWYLYIVFL